MKPNIFNRFIPFVVLLLVAIILPAHLHAQDNGSENEVTTFILVRHAEKADDGTSDPDLNADGVERAGKLSAHLSETAITAVYSTDYKRTRQTVEKIAGRRELEIKPYAPFHDNTLTDMLEAERGGIILISGHSNTTPVLVNRLIGEERFVQLDESDYDNMYIVTVTEVGNGQVVHLTY